jgi:hypothetical protein
VQILDNIELHPDESITVTLPANLPPYTNYLFRARYDPPGRPDPDSSDTFISEDCLRRLKFTVWIGEDYGPVSAPFDPDEFYFSLEDVIAPPTDTPGP